MGQNILLISQMRCLAYHLIKCNKLIQIWRKEMTVISIILCERETNSKYHRKHYISCVRETLQEDWKFL